MSALSKIFNFFKKSVNEKLNKKSKRSVPYKFACFKREEFIYGKRKNINKFEPKETLRIAILMLGVVWFYAGFTEVVKYLASRPRPRIVLSGEETFHYWYEWRPLYALFNGSNHKSFVSGHTSNSICLVSLLPLLMSLTKLKDKKFTYQISAYIGLVFTLIVGFSRIMASAHFLTDVVGGILLWLILGLDYR